VRVSVRRGTWLPAIAVTGLSDIDFHDLRHAGNRLVADAEANLRELVERMGHASSRAALSYLHSTNDRQRTLGHRGSRSHPPGTRRGACAWHGCGTNRQGSRVEDQ
jgi:hypothetical protein